MELKKNINPQDELTDSHDGIYLVDAGAGTGKTYSIVRRYGKLLDKNVKPENILLITFTKNAAEQMKEEVISKLSAKASISKLLEAPIMTFHSFCTRILKTSGAESPFLLGINEYLSGNFNVLEDSSFESELFRKFFISYSKSNKEKYKNILTSLENNHDLVLNIIKKLCSIGIFPKAKGWDDADFKKLKGDFKTYSDIFDKMNAEATGARNGEVLNKLNKKFKEATRNKLYTDFNKENIFEEKRINPEAKEDIFYDSSQDELIEFTREVYLSYIEYMLKRNLVNFDFMIMFAYLVLHNNHSLRKKMQFDYLMIDEFQDTDEIQFKLIMLICKNISGKANLCVVGDWKQGIYGFRNTSIKNITEFQNNLKTYREELNSDFKRIEFETEKYTSIVFENNYRSSDKILKFSRETLFIPGTKEDETNEDYINKNFKEPLKPQRSLDDITEIKFYTAKDRQSEYSLILQKISELISDNKKYFIREFDSAGKIKEERPVRYTDICVLSRKRYFCLEFQREAIKAGIPVNYSGGLEIFASEQGILTLAWLRLILNDKDIFGWLPILDKEGYTFPEISYFKDYLKKKTNKISIDNFTPSEDLNGFLNHIKTYRNNILYAVEAILKRYKYNDAVGNKIISLIKSRMDSDLITLNDLVQMIDYSSNSDFKIDYGNISEAVLTQTIHNAKGMEYPVVFLSNVNMKNFPGNKGDSSQIVYNPVCGLRSKTFFGSKGKYYYRFNNWRTDLLMSFLKKSDYDEERRLLYVAVTRAKQFLFVTASNPSSFFTVLSENSGILPTDNFEHEITVKIKDPEKITETISLPGQLEKVKTFQSPHMLMDDFQPEFVQPDKEEKEFSFKESDIKLKRAKLIHKIAHMIASGIDVDSEFEEIKKIKNFIKNLEAIELKSEVNFLYPKGEMIIRGTIDLLAIYKDRIDIYDYKTDSTKVNHEKYRVQLSVYKEVIKSIYKNMKVSGKIYYLNLDEISEI